ncbi:MAG: hypothetical protein HQK53_12745 [Oligoflexia bacterium]|nr:hypothetical protein [Oligoflexia bacterium]
MKKLKRRDIREVNRTDDVIVAEKQETIPPSPQQTQENTYLANRDVVANHQIPRSPSQKPPDDPTQWWRENFRV